MRGFGPGGRKYIIFTIDIYFNLWYYNSVKGRG